MDNLEPEVFQVAVVFYSVIGASGNLRNVAFGLRIFLKLEFFSGHARLVRLFGAGLRPCKADFLVRREIENDASQISDHSLIGEPANSLQDNYVCWIALGAKHDRPTENVFAIGVANGGGELLHILPAFFQAKRMQAFGDRIRKSVYAYFDIVIVSRGYREIRTKKILPGSFFPNYAQMPLHLTLLAMFNCCSHDKIYNKFMQNNFFDAHTHVHFPAYDGDTEAVLGRAKEAGVKMITVGTQTSTSESAIEFAKNNPGVVWATVGFHPGHLAEDWHFDVNEQSEAVREEFDIDKLKELAANEEVVAIGECGLDYFRLETDDLTSKDRQKKAFMEQIYLAKDVNKPLMIHCRDAFGDLIDILEANRDALLEFPGVIHFFSGDIEEAQTLLDMGFSFTFGGVITFSCDYDEVIKFLPPENILSETDAPYVTPAPYRGKRNEPAYVVEVVKKLAELKNLTVEEVARIIAQNVERIFGIKI